MTTAYSLKIITDLGGRDDVWVADVDDGVHSIYFLNVVCHSDHPVNLGKAMRGGKETPSL